MPINIKDLECDSEFIIPLDLIKAIEKPEIENELVKKYNINKNEIKRKILKLDYESLLNQVTNDNNYDQRAHEHLIKALGVLNRKFHNNNGTIKIENKINNEKFSLNNKHIFRFGNVELRVLHCFLFYSFSELRHAFNKVFKNRENESYLYSTESKRDNWLSSDDIEFNIKRLITNAGFYLSDDIDESWSCFIYFCNSYLDAICNSTHLLSQSEFYPYFFRSSNSIKNNFKKEIKIMQPPNHHEFYNEIDEKKVLFLTPFDNEVNDIYHSGNIYKLFKNLTPKKLHVHAIPSYISTYPNKPHNSFVDTANKMIKKIDEEFKKCNYDIFISSCGSYGSILSNHVRDNYNCSTLYQGNMSNTFFGIKQKTNYNYAKGNKNLEFWMESSLSKFKNMAKIDNGRYL